MAPLPFTPIELVATDPSRGIARRWSIRAEHDLFGMVCIVTLWGRIGAPGSERVRSFAEPEAAARYVGRLIGTRARAPVRIGVRYRSRGARCNGGS